VRNSEDPDDETRRLQSREKDRYFVHGADSPVTPNRSAIVAGSLISRKS
jgi:hypothetical protein